MGELMPRPPFEIVGMLVDTADKLHGGEPAHGLGAYSNPLITSALVFQSASVYHYVCGCVNPKAVYSYSGISASYYIGSVSVYRGEW